MQARALWRIVSFTFLRWSQCNLTALGFRIIDVCSSTLRITVSRRRRVFSPAAVVRVRAFSFLSLFVISVISFITFLVSIRACHCFPSLKIFLFVRRSVWSGRGLYIYSRIVHEIDRTWHWKLSSAKVSRVAPCTRLYYYITRKRSGVFCVRSVRVPTHTCFFVHRDHGRRH